MSFAKLIGGGKKQSICTSCKKEDIPRQTNNVGELRREIILLKEQIKIIETYIDDHADCLDTFCNLAGTENGDSIIWNDNNWVVTSPDTRSSWAWVVYSVSNAGVTPNGSNYYAYDAVDNAGGGGPISVNFTTDATAIRDSEYFDFGTSGLTCTKDLPENARLRIESYTYFTVNVGSAPVVTYKITVNDENIGIESQSASGGSSNLYRINETIAGLKVDDELKITYIATTTGIFTYHAYYKIFMEF